MSNTMFPLPNRGYSVGMNVPESDMTTSGDMNNIRPFDSLERRFRLGQRPGLKKVYDEQIASKSPIIAICSVSVVDYLGVS